MAAERVAPAPGGPRRTGGAGRQHDRDDRTVLVRGGRIISDPNAGGPTDPGARGQVAAHRRRVVAGLRQADVLVSDGRIVQVGSDDGRGGALEAPSGAVVIDAGGCVVLPGLVDLHTHLRQPGDEEAETIESGARAAALGGFTAVVAMPNTNPPLDSASAVRDVQSLARDVPVDVFVAGAITVARAGERLAPMAELARLGVRLFTDDGNGVQSAGMMRRALEYARGLGVVLAQHCEVASLASGGAMHEGEWSARLGLPGIPASAEEVMVARDLLLAREVGARIHLLHLSTSGSVDLVRAAKRLGVAVTAEATPHHVSLTDASAATYDPLFKVNPPLRSKGDVDAVRSGLADGTIDAIATDHAPHRAETKDLPFDQAPPGMIGLETAVGVVLTELADLPLAQVVAMMSTRPAAIAGIGPANGGAHGGPIAAGHAANLCIVDLEATWVVDPSRLASRSANSPYGGRKLTGRVRHTVLHGEAVVIDGEAQR